MPSAWPAALPYESWSATCDTLHAHTQVLGKLAVALAPPEPQLQHAALRLTARGWETLPLPAPDGRARSSRRSTCTRTRPSSSTATAACARRPDSRPAGRRGHARAVAAIGELAGAVEIDPTPQEVPWTVPLDEDDEHARYDPDQVASYFAAATRVALVLAAFRAPYRGRSTPVNAWWGSFDLAVSLFSGLPADPPADDFITRNSMDSQEVAVGWWPGDPRSARPPSMRTRTLPRRGSRRRRSRLRRRAGTRTSALFMLDWDDVVSAPDPHAAALEFAHSAFRHACVVCGWDPALPASAEGDPPPVG